MQVTPRHAEHHNIPTTNKPQNRITKTLTLTDSNVQNLSQHREP